MVPLRKAAFILLYVHVFVDWFVKYSSWSGDIRTSFKAVLVDLLSSSMGRKQETVKVLDRYLVKPAEDRSVWCNHGVRYLLEVAGVGPAKSVLGSVLLLHYYNHFMAPPGLCLGLPGWAGTRKENQSGFTGARDSEWQWHQLGICESASCPRQITMPASHHSLFTGRMPFLPPNQQRQSTGLVVMNGNEMCYSSCIGWW